MGSAFKRLIGKPLGGVQKNMRKSIQNKLFAGLFLLGFVSLGVLGGLAIWLARAEVEKEVLRRNLQTAQLVSWQIQSDIKTIFKSIEVESLNYQATNNSFEYVSLFFLKQSAPEIYEKIGVVNPTGGLILELNEKITNLRDITPFSFPPKNVANSTAFQAAKEGRQYISAVSYRDNSRTPYITVAHPIKAETGEFRGVITAEINLLQLQELSNRYSSADTGTIIIVDGQSNIIAHPNAARPGTKFVHGDRMSETKFASGTTQYVIQDKQFLVGFAPVKDANWNVFVEQNTEIAFAGINSMSFIVILVISLAVVVISFMAILLSRNITRGVRELATAANRITTTGSLDEQIPIKSQDEVGELTASFNGMILALRKTRQALEVWNHELGRKVENRTRELREINHQLEEANEQLIQANKHKSQFLANMSHELRTPLNAIIGFSEVLQDQIVGGLTEKQNRYVCNILNSGRHLLALVNDVLDLSKVEAGKMELHREPFDPKSVIHEVITQVSPMANAKELKVIADFAPNFDSLNGDRGRFRQVMYNLLSNAVKFTPNKGLVTVTGRVITPRDGSENEVLLFSVKDTGIGIPPDHLDRIFDTFHQVDSSYSRQNQGTGLGLALTRKLIEMHGGSIWVESQPNLGSTFTFQLPRQSGQLSLLPASASSDVIGVI
jgi:signal transduction histidine kinase